MWSLGRIAFASRCQRNADTPTDLVPVRAGGAEFLPLRALAAIAADYAKRRNARIEERKDDIPGGDLAHELIGIPLYADRSVSPSRLSFSHDAGASVFLLNAGFALLFAALAIAWRRANSCKARHIPFRAKSNFAC